MTLRTFDDPNSIEARQALLDRQCERNHPKRHRTKRRAVKRLLAKKQRVAHKIAINMRAGQRYYAAVKAFWAGESDAHP